MHYIGFDIGGTKCSVSLGKVNGGDLEILSKSQTVTLDSPYETLDRFHAFIEKWKEEYSVKKAGVSCGGPLDSENGIVISTPNLSKGWHGFRIVEYIDKEFGLKAKLENEDINLDARGKLIKKFLEHNDVQSFVILDDVQFDYIYENLASNFIQTDSKFGLTEEDVKKAIEILEK